MSYSKNEDDTLQDVQKTKSDYNNKIIAHEKKAHCTTSTASPFFHGEASNLIDNLRDKRISYFF